MTNDEMKRFLSLLALLALAVAAPAQSLVTPLKNAQLTGAATATGSVTFSPANANIVLSPSGTGVVTIAPATAGSINKMIIGGTTPLAGTFTTLTATGAVALSPASANVVLSPTGTGVVTIAPATAGSLNNVIIGGSTPLAGTFTTLTAATLSTTGAVALSPASANVVLSPTGTGVVTIAPATAGSVNNVVIGGSTPLAATFTSLVATTGFQLPGTVTAGGTTGAQTINKLSGTINFAAGSATIVVTDSLVTTSSIVLAVVRTNDSTALIKNVVPASGSFTVRLNATATAETSVGFVVVSP